MPLRPTIFPLLSEEPRVEAIHSFFSRRRGLLRCARNDGEGVWSASCQRFVEVLPRHCEERSAEAIHAFFPWRRGLLPFPSQCRGGGMPPLRPPALDGLPP